MTGHWPIGGDQGGHTTNLRRGHSSHILVQKITQATLSLDSVTSESTFCALRDTQEVPKKHYEAGRPEQLPTDALS